jgi:starch synthase
LDVRILLPLYGWIDRRNLTRLKDPLEVQLGRQAISCPIWEGRAKDVPVYLIENRDLYHRPYLYGPPGGTYEDNGLRFSLLSQGALAICPALGFWPHVFHVHDWQASLVPVFLNTTASQPNHGRAACVLTIHNLAYQGWFGKDVLACAGLDGRHEEHLGLIINDRVNLLKGGIHHSTLITTVSPTYASEIQTAGYGEGLDGVLRSRRLDLFGVLNGIDEQLWNPATDPHLPRNYTPDDLSGKQYCKAALQQEARLEQRPDVPLIGMVSRLVQQKGIDILISAMDRLLLQDIQIVMLGTGEPELEEYFRTLSKRSSRFRAWVSFDERLAHLIEAGSDLFLMPSRYEPCGLNQMYSQRYGTLPIVRATGGLRDTVQNFDAATGDGSGFVFNDANPVALAEVVKWASDTYRHSTAAFRAAQRQAMLRPHGWNRSAASYEYFYRLAIVRRHGG